jgi:hypothetical protein
VDNLSQTTIPATYGLDFGCKVPGGDSHEEISGYGLFADFRRIVVCSRYVDALQGGIAV